MKHITSSVLFMVLSVLTAHFALATPPPPPDFGLTGLREVSVHISETVDNNIKLYSINSSAPCGELTGLFTKAGLHVRRKDQLESSDAGDLFLAIDRKSQGQGKGILYFVSLNLLQDVRLTRDPTRKLSVPSTYEDERYGVVARGGAQQEACAELRSMLSNFLSLWQGWNQKH